MLNEQAIFLLCVSGAVAAVGFFVARLIVGKADARLRERLAGRRSDAAKATARTGGTAELFQRIGSAAARPFMPETRAKVSEMRRRLARAGIYSPTAVKLVTGMKVICLALGL